MAIIILYACCLGFSSSSWLDGMKDRWCSSIVWLLSTQVQNNGEKDLYGALVQFDCYQHRYDLNGRNLISELNGLEFNK